MKPGNLITPAKWKVEWQSGGSVGFCKVFKPGKPNLTHYPSLGKVFPNPFPARVWKPGDLVGLVVSNTDEELVVQLIPEPQRVHFAKCKALDNVFKPIRSSL